MLLPRTPVRPLLALAVEMTILEMVTTTSLEMGETHLEVMEEMTGTLEEETPLEMETMEIPLVATKAMATILATTKETTLETLGKTTIFVTRHKNIVPAVSLLPSPL